MALMGMGAAGDLNRGWLLNKCRGYLGVDVGGCETRSVVLKGVSGSRHAPTGPEGVITESNR